MTYAQMADLKPAYPVFVSGQEIAQFLLKGSPQYRDGVLTLWTIAALYELATAKEPLPFVFSCYVKQFYGNGPFLSVRTGEQALEVLNNPNLAPYQPDERLEVGDNRYGDHYLFCHWDGKMEAQQLTWVPDFAPLEAENWIVWRRNVSKVFEVVRVNGVAAPPSETDRQYTERSFMFGLLKQQHPGSETMALGECREVVVPPLYPNEKTYTLQRIV